MVDRDRTSYKVSPWPRQRPLARRPTAPVYALVGADAFLQLQKLREVLAALPPDVQRVDVDGERAELADVLDDLRSFAMFGGGKVVVVRDADAFISRFREQLEEYVASPSDSATLVLRLTSLPENQRIYKAIAKVGQVRGLQPAAGPEAVGGRSTRRPRTRSTIAPDAAEVLAELIGADLGRLDTELAKLAIAADGRRSTPTRCAAAVAFQREREMWEMTNELAAGRPGAGAAAVAATAPAGPVGRVPRRHLAGHVAGGRRHGPRVQGRTGPGHRQARVEVQGPHDAVHPHLRAPRPRAATAGRWTCWRRSTSRASRASATPRRTSSGSS